MWLSDQKTSDLDPEAKYIFVVSLGSTEQHGPFAPLGTDTYIQDAILRKVERVLNQVVFLPTIPITHSTEHLGFLGTVTLEASTLSAILRDITTSLKANAASILFVSWHGGNKEVIDRFVKSKWASSQAVELRQITFGDESTDKATEKLLGGPVDDHAGNTEVSLMLALYPKLVRKPGKRDKKQALEFAWDKPVVKVSPNGVVDNHPKWVVSKEIGDTLLSLYANHLVKEIGETVSKKFA